MNFTIKEIAKIIEASEPSADERLVHHLEFDSRKIKANDIFLTLPGVRDGVEFIDVARVNGAIEVIAPNVGLKTDDRLGALHKLAKAYIEKNDMKVVAITGSNGKTTTKDLVESVLSKKYKTYKTQGNYNNEIGMPYTVLSADYDTQILILEMGMDHEGDIDVLVNIAKPDYSIITIIGESHIENLGSRENIAKEKGKVKTGFTLIPEDEPLLDGTPVGLSKVTNVEQKEDSTKFTVKDLGEFEIPLSGLYNVENALKAIYLGLELNVDIKDIKDALKTVEVTKNRGDWHRLPNNISIFSDVYNANPTAMKLAIENFQNTTPKNVKNILVLGDMLELGENSTNYHKDLKTVINADEIFLYGDEMAALAAELPKANWFAKNAKEELISELKRAITPDTRVMLKASNSMKLSEVVDEILNT
ncbi:MAG: UDP-N-acetylmuramoyl-tripeptide--D-alanyl-D-alanine ligase [Lactobacillales bacterium]|jgi:UDP-N-acetylmuramoyl-tripeptide--D-alanyl-D-alanine ligase|nr:UDP-N-acetylmuramoyl-tripeptide--D-alanyl-D-alanine ligase [Lactobacillales bacterium]